ncbi:winged helix-turn-helix transcriptional regulator [Microbispora sp. SCL1-1]|uniref:MarR family winged helix-turn-helix transcriptional regulator n=1 Tax=unclassified Microbispora TaxID=2614687 RepID=UPI00115BF52A|nr:MULTISPECIES: MarR family winged helix-turn-helix transcriptional regulator [unclassified Microbispora]NJP27806.1 winged helix-turn-helix transcriptional regulator [Microbispora sp. CL1-1]TQS10574.1 winged helix-turn-helix transcriptional regulator [Microbispora sp. SCL1-1]
MEVTSSVWTIVRALHRAAQIQRRAAAASEPGPVALGLLNLAAQGGVRPSAAAAELDVPPQSVTRAVAELERLGFVHRVGDASDGRSYAIEVTDAGRRERARFQAEMTARFSAHLTGWEPEEIRRFADQLDRLVTSLASDAPARPAAERKPNAWRTSS